MKTQLNKSRLTINKYQISRIKNLELITGGDNDKITRKTKPTTGGRF